LSSLEDAISILGCFTLAEPSLSQTELARRTNCPKATASRIMKTLRERGILEYDAARRLYSPGARLFELGQICRSNNSFLDQLNAELEQICNIGGHTAYVTAFEGQQLVTLRMIRGSSPLAITAIPGGRAWPHATSNGRAMLALVSEQEWQIRVPQDLPFVTRQAPQTHDELLEKIAKIRATGRSHSHNDSYEGVSSEGIAVRDPGTNEIIGIAISYPTNISTPDLQDRISGLLEKMRVKLFGQ
jgi:DNA-binding IclR family transcriptional regulator